MSTETELKKMFSESGPSLGQIDLSRVLRRSSRRRVAQQVAVGSATTLAVAGIGVAGFTGIRWLVPSTGSASSVSASTPTRDTSPGNTTGQGRLTGAPIERINRCGGLADIDPNADGLVLTSSFPAADVSTDRVSGTATLTNTGMRHIVGGSADSPEIILSKDGIVRWHSDGAVAAMGAIADLAPGASMTYLASFQPVTCTVEDDSNISFRADLPHVAAGGYQVSATLDLRRQNADGSFLSSHLATGPVSASSLR